MPAGCCWVRRIGRSVWLDGSHRAFGMRARRFWSSMRLVTLVGQRVFGIALGYEDLIDHDELRHDPMMAVLAGKLSARRKGCAPRCR